MALLSCRHSEGFSYGQGLPLQTRLLQARSSEIQPPAGATEGAEAPLAGRSSLTTEGFTVFHGVAGLVSLVTLYSRLGKAKRQRWRRAVNSQGNGYRAWRADKRPTLLGPEKPPYEKKKMYHYYCNKIYKVIRESTSATVEVAPTSQKTDEFVSPSVWNKPVFRAAAVVSGGAVAGQVLPFSAMLHLSAFGIWLGTNVWTTFVAGLTMFKSLPRQQFGSLQAKLFPKYFQIGAACTSIMLLTGSRMGLPLGPALCSLVATLANLLYLEPEATRVMFERYERENQGLKDADTDKQLKATFSKLHGMSSLANLIALVGLIAHGTLLASKLTIV